MTRKIALTLILVLVLGFGGCMLYSKPGSETKANEKGIANVETAVVKRGNLQVTVDANGTIQPLNIVSVNSKASGKILKLAVDEGDYVRQGDVIARIETTYVQIDVNQAKADLKSANAQRDLNEALENGCIASETDYQLAGLQSIKISK